MTLFTVKEVARNIWKNQFYLAYGGLVVLFISSIAYIELMPSSADLARKKARINSSAPSQGRVIVTNSQILSSPEKTLWP